MRMTSLLIIGSALGGFTFYGAENGLKPSDLQEGKRYLEQTRAGVIGATKGLSQAQWTWKPAPDRWSVAEIVEHMVLAQELMLGPIREQLSKSPAAGNADKKELQSPLVQ